MKPKKPKKPVRTYDPLEVVQQAAKLTPSALVSYSGGKDSMVALDLCCKYFQRVAAFYMYFVPDLEHEEEMLRAVESRYNIKVHRIAHWGLGIVLRNELFSEPIKNPGGCPMTKLADSEALARKQSGIDWLASGHRKADSLERRAMITSWGNISFKFKRFYPIADWSSKAVYAHIKFNNIPLTNKYRFLKEEDSKRHWLHNPAYLAAIKREYPRDFAKIKAFFPHIEAMFARQAFMPPVQAADPEAVAPGG